jgi:excisionase family DNA binding protein
MKPLVCLPKRALRKKEAALILGVSEPTLDKIIAAGRLRAFRPTDSSVRVLPEDLQNFIDSCATKRREVLTAL